MTKKEMKKGVYAKYGDYHKQLNKKWAYYPIFLSKIRFVEDFLRNKKHLKILDAGCGEGVLVDKLLSQRYDISGFDINYSSNTVKRGSILKIPFNKKTFDIVLCLDVLQYLSTQEQKKAIGELKRVLKDDGRLILAVPNLKHFANRLYEIFCGKYKRTDSKTFPKGDKPMDEYLKLIKQSGLCILKSRGYLPTNFILSTMLITKFPDKFLWLYKIINFFAIRSWCFENLFICEK